MSKLLSDIKDGRIEVNNLREENSYDWALEGIDKVLQALQSCMEKGIGFDEKLLRSMKDIYVVSFRNFDGTKLDLIIKSIDTQLSLIYKSYNDLKPLGLEFDI